MFHNCERLCVCEKLCVCVCKDGRHTRQVIQKTALTFKESTFILKWASVCTECLWVYSCPRFYCYQSCRITKKDQITLNLSVWLVISPGPPSFSSPLHSNPSANDHDFYFDHSSRDPLFSSSFVLLAVYCSVGLIYILCIFVCREKSAL